jgi:hypothetical protein
VDNFGDLFGGLGDILGGIFGGEAGAAGAEGVMGIADFLSPEGDRRSELPFVVYERFLCGAPRLLNINDR